MRRFAKLVLLVAVVAPWSEAAAQGSAALEEGIRQYTQQGNPREAIRRLGDALDSGIVGGMDGVRAHVYMAHSFLALGDTASAVPHIQTALAAEPCLVPEEGLTPPPWRALYERYRDPGASCGRKLPIVALQSMLVPGWGQHSIGRGEVGRYFFAATAIMVGGGWLLHRRAETAYADYQTTTRLEDVTELFDRAQQSRTLAMVLGGAGAAVYLWNVIDVVASGADHDRTLARVRPLALQPTIGTDGAGVRLGFSISVD